MSERKVRFVVVSERLTGSDLRRVIGAEPDGASEGTARFPFQATWELRAAGSGDIDLSRLVEDVLSRVAACQEAIEAVRTDHDEAMTCKLEIVQYVGDDQVGPGFVLSAEHIAVLARLGAFVDVDQYYVR